MRVRAVSGLAFVSLLISAVTTAGVGVWTTNGPPGGSVDTVMTSPRVPGIVYAGNGTGLFKSNDNGATWTLAAPGYTPLATGPTTVYATDGSASLFESSDQGSHWTPLIQNAAAGTAYVLAVDPVTPTTLYLATAAPGAASNSRSSDGGLTWTEIGATLGRVTAISIAPSLPSTLYEAAVPFLSTGGVAGVSKSLDYGATWTLLTASPQDVTALVTDPSNSSVVYAATMREGVQKSTDGGVTFVPANSLGNDLALHDILGLCIDPLEPNRLYATGAVESTDGGASWQSIFNGLPPPVFFGVQPSIAIDATGTYLHLATVAGVYDYQINSSACNSTAETLCLNNGRFAVTADFQSTPEGPSTPATAVPLTSDTGYFWFFDPANIELVTKVLNGCTVNNEYWVFASGLTNVGVQINVTDTVTGATKPYANTFGTPFQPIQDTSAFPCP